MSYQKLADTALKLSEKTKGGSVIWEDTAQKGTYQASINRIAVQISQVAGTGWGDECDYKISIFDSDGDMVESFESQDIDPLLPAGVNAQEMLDEMYNAARRMALGTEQVLDALLESLEEDDDLPF